MPYFASQIANEFITRAKTEGISLGALKLQKLLYLAHGWHLAFLGKPLLKETIKAWKYGPVVPALYQELKGHGERSITELLSVPDNASPLDPDAIEIIDEVWKKYGRMSGLSLSMITHEPGFAWDLIRQLNRDRVMSPAIPDDYIQDEFERRKVNR